jgi:hypothetical protein
MSMDFVYDLKEKLEEQKIEYALCIIKPIKNGDTRVELFYNIELDESFESMCDAFNIACGAEPEENVDIEFDSSERSTPVNTPEHTPTPPTEKPSK